MALIKIVENKLLTYEREGFLLFVCLLAFVFVCLFFNQNEIKIKYKAKNHYKIGLG